jgi:hypothetical protein
VSGGGRIEALGDGVVELRPAILWEGDAERRGVGRELVGDIGGAFDPARLEHARVSGGVERGCKGVEA